MFRYIYRKRFILALLSLILGIGFGLKFYFNYNFGDYKIPISFPFIGKPTIAFSYLNEMTFNLATILTSLGVGVFILFPSTKRKHVYPLSLAGYKWNVNDLSRGFLITGVTGSGKTAAAISRIVRQLFLNTPNFGAVCLDVKGNFFAIIENIARALGLDNKVVTLQVRPDSILIRLSTTSESEVNHLLKKIREAVEKENNISGFETGDINQNIRYTKDGSEFQIVCDYSWLDTEYFLTLKIDGLELSGSPFVKKVGTIPCENWKPKATFNLLSYEGIPLSSLAKMISDTGSSMGSSGSGGGNSDYFQKQGEIHIAAALHLIDSIEWLVEKCPDFCDSMKSLDSRPKNTNFKGWSDQKIWQEMPNYKSFKTLAQFFLNGWLDKKFMKWISDKILRPEKSEFRNYEDRYKRLEEEVEHFNLLLKKGENELGSVIGTIQNFLAFFQDPDLNDVFSARKNTIEFEMIDAGKIFSVSIPQRYQRERQYINTFFKMIYYNHANLRFGRMDSLPRKNQLFLIMDEAQGGVTDTGGDGMADHSVIDKTREAKSTVIFATQSTTSFDGVISPDSKKKLLVNLANQIHFQAADEDCANYIGGKVGKVEKWKYSYSSGGKGGTTNSRSREEVFEIKPHELMRMKKFEAVIIHCEDGVKRTMIPPVTPKGKIPNYYYDL